VISQDELSIHSPPVFASASSKRSPSAIAISARRATPSAPASRKVSPAGPIASWEADRVLDVAADHDLGVDALEGDVGEARGDHLQRCE